MNYENELTVKSVQNGFVITDHLNDAPTKVFTSCAEAMEYVGEWLRDPLSQPAYPKLKVMTGDAGSET